MYSRNCQTKKPPLKEEDVSKLVWFAEEQEQKKHAESSIVDKDLDNRLHCKEMEYKRLKLKHKIAQKSKQRKPSRAAKKRLPPPTASQPTMSQYIADSMQYTEEQHHDFSSCSQHHLPIYHKQTFSHKKYSQQEDSGYDNLTSLQASITPQCFTPDAKIKES